jgi:LPXTG-site transpeptidase (sortase) family protein
MKPKLIALGIVSPLFLAVCLMGTLLLGLTSWFILRPENNAPVIKKIATVGLLPLPASALTPTVADNPTQTDAFAPQPETPQASNPAAAPIAEPSATPNVEQVLGFTLPPNTVNSVSQTGIATRLVIPKLNLDAPVVLAPIENQTWKVDDLGQAVGHLEGTAPPGSNSNIVLAAHVTLAAGVYGPFAGLAQLAPGDAIIVYQGEQAFQYVVDGYQLVERTSVDVTYPTSTGQITLITCNSWNRDTNRYEQRIVVKGHLAP